MDNSKKSNSKKINYILRVVKDDVDFEKLFEGSALTIEGFSLSDENINNFIEFLIGNDFISEEIDILELFVIRGSNMNEKYDLTGDNRYPDDINIISIELDSLKNIPRLSIERFGFGGRWFDDIVNNNIRRENNNSEFEF